MPEAIDYSLFSEFINNYSVKGFKGINNQDPFMLELNKKLEGSNQFFFVADIIGLQILYTSPQIKEILGIEPEIVDPNIVFTNTHPEDRQRLTRGFNIELEKAREIYMNKSGSQFLSSNFRRKKSDGSYIHFLTQVYLFYSNSPVETVYALEIYTPIENFSEIQNSHFHWYIGNDSANFRYPDNQLLAIGSIFSDREIEIIQHIQKGFKTNQIAKVLFLSTHTIFTHRRNILKKAGKSTMAEVIFDLNTKGVI